MQALMNVMTRIVTSIVMLTVLCFCCKAQLTNLTYKDKHAIIIAESTKHPEESKFADKYLGLTDSTINLSDSLISEMMRSIGQTPLSYLSNDQKAERFFNRLLDMRSLALKEVKDPKSKEKINNKFVDAVASKGFRVWTTKLFNDKSTIESLALLREIQTDCLELTDLVFDEIIDRTKK
jgi:hypothetical protein